MRMWLRLGVAIGVLGTLGNGCSSGPLPNADVNAFCESKATQECQVAESCNAPSTAACISLRQTVCITDANAAMKSGTRAYSQPAAGACISAVQSAYSNAPSEITFATLQQVDQTCAQVFPGTVPDGGSCKTDFDCANQEVCSPVEPGSSTMVCATAVSVNKGDPCANVGDVCEPGTFCTGVPAKCAVGGTADNGATCTPTVGCATGDYCQIDAGATKGKCITAGSKGSLCTVDANCAAAAPYCDLNIEPKGGKTGQGSCETGLFSGLGTDGADCTAFGGGS